MNPRSILVLLTAAVVTVLTFAPAATAAGCGSGPATTSQLQAAEAELRSGISSARGSAGLDALSNESQLTAIAREHAGRMASSGSIYHNDAYMGMLDALGATMLAENVGMGCSGSQLHSAFMASPAHRSNILTAPLTHVGVGAATDGNGTIFVVEAFAALAAAPASAPPTVEPQPEPVATVEQASTRAAVPATAPPRQEPAAEAQPVAADPEPVARDQGPKAAPVDDVELVATRAATGGDEAQAALQEAGVVPVAASAPLRATAVMALLAASMLALLLVRGPRSSRVVARVFGSPASVRS